MDIIFLFYGLAFLVLGLVIVVRHEPDSALHLARPLRLLAAFGFVHGFLEWTELWRIVHGDTPALAMARPFILLASFVLLFEFGRRLVLMSLSAPARAGAWLLKPWVHLLVLGAVAVAVIASTHPLVALAAWSRYLPGFLGACLAGAGCYLYRSQRVASGEDTPASVSLAWNAAAAGFFAYGILGGLVVTDVDLPGGGIFSEEVFQAAASAPVQLFRAICAVLIAAAFGRIMRMFVEERRLRLRYAVDAGQYSLAQFQESKARYEAILNAASEGIIGLDRDGNLVFANQKALDTLGYAENELTGKAFHVVAHYTTASGKPHPAEDCPILLTLRDGKPRCVDADLFWRKNKTWFPAAYRVVPLGRADKLSGVVILLRNLAD